MRNPSLARELEKAAVALPADWREQILTIDSPSWHDYTHALIHNLGLLLKDGSNFNAMHVVSIASVTIFKMIKANYPTQKVVASYQIAPEFLAILLTDLKTRRSAVECFNTETTDIVGAYVSKA